MEFDQWKAEILALPVEEQRQRLNMIATVWDMDWDFLRTCYYARGLTDEEVSVKRKEYFDNCRKTMQDIFGYIPYQLRDGPAFTTIPKATWRVQDDNCQDH